MEALNRDGLILPANPSVAIVGAGAIGTYYGGRLALAGAGVHLFVRSGIAALRAPKLIIAFTKSISFISLDKMPNQQYN